MWLAVRFSRLLDTASYYPQALGSDIESIRDGVLFLVLDSVSDVDKSR